MDYLLVGTKLFGTLAIALNYRNLLMLVRVLETRYVYNKKRADFSARFFTYLKSNKSIED